MLEYKHKLTSNATARTFTSVTTLTALNVTKSSGGTNSSNAATLDLGFDMAACFKNGTVTAATLTGMTCWVMSLDKATSPASSGTWGNGMYNLAVYNYQSTDVNQTHAASEIVWAAGAGPANGGPEATTNNFGTTAKFTLKAKLTKASQAAASSGSTTLNAITTHWTAATNNLGTVITGNVPVVVLTHDSATLFTSVVGTFTYLTAADSALFATNGPLWSTQMRSFSQSSALMLFGFRW